MSRGFKIQPVSKTTPEIENSQLPDWLYNVASSSDKETAVEVARKRKKENQIYLDELKLILTKKQRYATVNDAVADMIERVGLNKIEAMREDLNKSLNVKANENEVQEKSDFPESLKKYEDEGIKEYLENFIKSQFKTYTVHGTSVPQMQHDLLKILQLKFGISPEDIYNTGVKEFLQKLIDKEKESNPTNNEMHPDGKMSLDGSDFDSNNDMWKGLQPATR
jgi:hypothetical protein